ncbi:FMN-dependent NADH-azoreductase [Stutzerimonas urumqiensis]|uniref:FMN-dependent NADH-azoreductase n=1 Tax=Stutzerimonas urumqiensis TaxID=638269 RepID=UPI000EAD7545|nr:NAD(P)H-dependent oxidoreductase [Stutzerimonas urumqiensis]
MTTPHPLRVLRLAASPRGAESESLRLSEHILDALSAQSGHRRLELSSVDLNDVPPVDGGYARMLASPRGAGVPHPGDSLHRSDRLIDQLDRADILVIATPMHNYSVPSSLKAWIDHVVRIQRTFESTPQGKRGLLRDRPVYVAVSSGGYISGPRARQPDFLRPYLQAALATVGLNSLHCFTLEGTALGDDALTEARRRAFAMVAEYFGRSPSEARLPMPG